MLFYLDKLGMNEENKLWAILQYKNNSDRWHYNLIIQSSTLKTIQNFKTVANELPYLDKQNMNEKNKFWAI